MVSSQADNNGIAKLVKAQQEYENELEKRIIDAVTEKVTAKVLASLNAQTQQPNEGEVWLTQKQVCKRYRISLTTINRRQHEGVFKPKYIGRKALYRVQDIENYLNGNVNI